MDKTQRHTYIINALKTESHPISATQLAKQTQVSRQLIVGDIALLRAQGYNIQASHKGYVLDPQVHKYTKVIVLNHTPSETELELQTLVENHCAILDVSIQHPTYGEISGSLNIETLEDVKHFTQADHPLLSLLTDGIHSHTIAYDDEKDLESALQALQKLNFLYE